MIRLRSEKNPGELQAQHRTRQIIRIKHDAGIPQPTRQLLLGIETLTMIRLTKELDNLCS